jgi:hypothetical protein
VQTGNENQIEPESSTGHRQTRERTDEAQRQSCAKASAEQERETRLEVIAAEIESVLGTAIMRVAALVAEAHELHRYQHGDGGFEGWVERRLKMSRRTAYNLFDVHKRFGHQSVQILHTLPRSILYLIAPDSVPEAAVTEVMERVQNGEKLSHGHVKEIITGHKRKPPASNKKRKPAEQAQATLAPRTVRERQIEAASPAEQKRDVAPPVAPADPALSPNPVAVLADNTTMPTAGSIIIADEEPKALASAPPPGPIIHSAATDFSSVDRGIDILYSRWTVLAYQVIEEAHEIDRVKVVHDKAAGLELQSHLAKDTELERQARVIRLDAERKLGQWLIDSGRTGERYMGRPPQGVKVGTNPDPDVITLKKLRLNKQQSRAYQRIAKMTDRVYAALVEGKPARRRLPHRKRLVRRLRAGA